MSFIDENQLHYNKPFMNKLKISVIALLGVFTACNTDESIEPVETGKEEQEETVDSLWLQEEDIYNAPFKNQKKIALDENQQAISEKVNDFSWVLFSKSFEKKKEKNLKLVV